MRLWKDLLTLSLRERQLVQAIGVRLRSLTYEGNLESEEFMMYSGDNARESSFASALHACWIRQDDKPLSTQIGFYVDGMILTLFTVIVG